jgi:uncharacterized protein DUF1302
MSDRRALSAVVGLLGATLAVFAPVPASATQKFGPLQLSGNLQSQNIVRTPDVSTYEFIQNRNTAHVRLEYDWIQAGKFYDKYELPFIDRSKLFLLWRGVYDSIYDTTPGFLEKEDIHGKAYGNKNVFEFATDPNGKNLRRSQLNLESLGGEGRTALKFENTLREAYADVKLRGIPLTIRGGKQQIVWGETDNFRMLDRANALDLTWHFQQEIPAPAFGWDEIRRTYWMLKFLYDLGDIYKLSQNFIEWYWNPGDWYPAKQAYLPQPWGLRFYNPLTNQVDGVFNRGVCDSGPNHQCTALMNGTRLFEQGDYKRNPFDNSQVGVRYHGIMPFGMEFTLNYFYQRFAGDDGTNFAPLKGLPKNDANTALAFNQLIPHGIFPAEYFAPYVHTLGMSANYSDEAYTQTVFRMETIYDIGIPFFDLAKETVIDRPLLPGISKKNMWKGMIAFDRPTWMRFINKKSTVFLTGQFFWHYLVNNPGCAAQDFANLTSEQKAASGVDSCLVGALDLPSNVRTGVASEGKPAFRDKIRDWEALATFAAFTFYRGGSIVPVIGLAVDPVNQFSMEPFWTIDYVVNDAFVVNLSQRYFVTPRGHGNSPIFETWGLAGLNQGRSETVLRLTLQF